MKDPIEISLKEDNSFDVVAKNRMTSSAIYRVIIEYKSAQEDVGDFGMMIETNNFITVKVES